MKYFSIFTEEKEILNLLEFKYHLPDKDIIKHELENPKLKDREKELRVKIMDPKFDKKHIEKLSSNKTFQKLYPGLHLDMITKHPNSDDGLKFSKAMFTPTSHPNYSTIYNSIKSDDFKKVLDRRTFTR